MLDGDDYIPLTLTEAMEKLAEDRPRLSVLLPIRHDGDAAVFTWGILEGQNAMWTRSPDARTRAKFACALALRAHGHLVELAEEDPDVEILA